MRKINVKRAGALALAIAGFVAFGRSKAIDLHAEGSHGCTNAILHGGYGAATTGLIDSSTNPNDITLPTFVPFAEAVQFIFDGGGNLSGSSTANYGGSSFPVTFTGTYSVKAGCTGNLTVNAGVNGIIHRDLVIVDGGKEVEFVDTDPGFVIAGYMKKQGADEE
jgi:hypothetical protein